MDKINSKNWWENRGLDYLKKNDLRIRTAEDEAASKHVHGSVIEVGCAFGGFTRVLPLQTQYLGIDISGSMIHKARQLHPERIFIRQSLDEIIGILGKTFTSACAFQLLEHFPDVEKPLEQLAQIARERIVFTVPRGIPQNHQRENDGHLIGWEDEAAVENTFSKFGNVIFWKGNGNHICGVIGLKQ